MAVKPPPGGAVINVAPKGSTKKISYIWMPDKNGNLVKADSAIVKKGFTTLPQSAVLALQEYLISVEGKVNPTRAQRNTLWNSIVDGAVKAFETGKKQTPWDVLTTLTKTTPNVSDTAVTYTQYDRLTADATINKIAKSMGFNTALLTEADREDFFKKIAVEAKASGKETRKVNEKGVIETIITPSLFDAKAFTESYLWAKVNVDDVTTLPSTVISQLSGIKALLRAYGVSNLSDKEVNKIGLDLASGTKTLQQIQADFQQTAIKNYPQYADRFKNNPTLTVADIAQPIINTLASAWEMDPASFDVMDPNVDRFMRPDGVLGKAAPASIAEITNWAMFHPNFDKTTKAQGMARDAATGVARAMGFGI